MTLGEGVKYVRDAPLEALIGRKQSHARYLFKLFIDELESVEVLTDLLAMVGEDLHSVWFASTGAGLHTIDLSALAVTCPKLEKLTLLDVLVVVTDAAALRNWPLKSLTVDGVVTGFSACLDDSTHRLARELVKLELSVPRDWNFTDADAFALEMHNGDFLSLVKTKFPIDSKAALLSVWTHDTGADMTPPHNMALFHLDVNTLELISGFAATPEQRSVRVSRGHVSLVVFHEDEEERYHVMQRA
jgi:hypothetical protein